MIGFCRIERINKAKNLPFTFPLRKNVRGESAVQRFLSFGFLLISILWLSDVVIAQTWKEIARRSPSEIASNDYFGISVYVSGDYAAIGATSENAVYMYYRDQGGSDNWGLLKKIVSSDVAAGDQFGRSVCISGDYLVVGASHEDDVAADAGAAYIFYKDQGGADNWGQVKKITASDGNGNDCFGWWISISGDYVVVGSIYNDYDAADANWKDDPGSAYIYKKDQGGADNWGQLVKITAPAADRHNGDYFGGRVGISGNYVVVSANGEDLDENGLNSKDNAGAVYLYLKDQGGADNWGFFKKLVASDRAAGDKFGYGVHNDGNNIVIGAWLENGEAGAAYLFNKDQGGADNWGEIKKITPSDAAATDRFGLSVSLSGNNVIIGAYQEDEDAGGANTLANAGSAYIFNKDQGGIDNWGQVQKIVASNRASSDYFGYCVFMSGTDAIVGAYGKNSGTGFAYFYNTTDESPVAGFSDALQFDGTDDEYVNVANPSAIDFGSSDFTVEFWAKIVSDGTYHILFVKSFSVGVWDFQGKRLFIDSDGYINFDSKGDGGLQSNFRITTDRWTHIALSFEDASNTLKLYINGILDKTGTCPISPDIVGHILAIGHHYDGSIDECRIWQAELTEAEIQNWMYREIDITHPSYANLMLYYKLNEGSGLTTADCESGNNNGTLTNMETPGDWIDSNIRDWYVNEDNSLNGKLVGGYRDGSSTDGSDWDMTFQIVTQPNKGTITIPSDNNFTFTPKWNENGSDSFTYKVSKDGSTWSGNETVDLTITGVNDAPIAGSGKGLDFDGSNDYVQIPYDASLNIGDEITIEAWIYPRSVDGWRGIVTHRTGNDQTDHIFALWNGKISYNLHTSDNWFNLHQVGLNPNEWQHVAVSVTADKHVYLYINGTQYYAGFYTGVIDQKIYNWRIGREVWDAPNVNFFDGRMDEIRIWNVFRTEAQIQADMYKPLVGNEAGLRAYWRCDKGDGTKLYDATTNENDGTFYNMDPATDWIESDAWKNRTINEDNNLVLNPEGYDPDGDPMISSQVTAPTNGVLTFGSVTYTPTANYNGADAFTYRVSDGTLTDDFDISVIINSFNDAPVLAAIEGTPLEYNENETKEITNAVTLTDVDDVNIESAVVQITGNYQNGEDVLSVVDENGITSVWDAVLGRLTLTGSSTKANYQDILRNVVYENMYDVPTTSVEQNDIKATRHITATPRTVSFTVNDGDLNSNVITRTIEVNAVDDAPVLEGIESGAIMYTEGEGTRQITNTIRISDVDNATIENAVIMISGNYQRGEDILHFSDTGNIIGTFNEINGILELRGSDTHENYVSALRSVIYENVSSDPFTDTRMIIFQVNDGELNSGYVYRYIQIIKVNQAPVINGLPEQVTFVCGECAVIDICTCVSDEETPDNQLNYQFTPGNSSLQVDFNSSIGEITITAAEGFSGEVDLLVRVTDPDGAYAEKTIRVIVEAAVGTKELEIPSDYILYQNYPNPFNPTTTIRYGLPEDSHVRVVVYNMLGQQVAELVNRHQSAGYHELSFEAENINSGIYFYKMETEGFIEIKKMIIVK